MTPRLTIMVWTPILGDESERYAKCPVTGKEFHIDFENGLFWASWDLSLDGQQNVDLVMAAAEAQRNMAVLPYIEMVDVNTVETETST